MTNPNAPTDPDIVQQLCESFATQATMPRTRYDNPEQQLPRPHLPEAYSLKSRISLHVPKVLVNPEEP